MFDIGWDEMALVAVLALIVIGPKDLPAVLRQMGKWTRKARELAGEFQRGVDEMVRESEISELKTQVEKVADTNALRREIEKTIDPTGDIARSLEPPVMPSLDQPASAEPAPAPAAVSEDNPPARPPAP
jgi:sec-independent protein translocase protein TatB